MINCLTCYYLHDHGTKIFCPFFDRQPCFRGLHCFKKTDKPMVKTEERPIKIKIKLPKNPPHFPPGFYSDPPPKYIPPIIKRKNAIDWESKHQRIFELIRKGYGRVQIALDIDVNKPALDSYLERYDHHKRRYKGR